LKLQQDYPYYSISAEECIEKLKTDEETGLKSQKAKKRREQCGPNKLPEKGQKSPVILFLEQFRDFLVLILTIAALIAFFADKMVDVYVIIGVILFNAILGFVQEYKAEKAIASLKKLIRKEAKVIRDGKKRVIDVTELVPGDLVVLEEGSSIAADARLVHQKNLKTVESSLTGESLPVGKATEIIEDKEISQIGRAHV
jgi:P-type Ca2+ transporter type 2C